VYKLCKTEQSAARQRALEMGLLAAMQTRRYEDINISDLCHRMGIPRKSFYRYFSGKDGALHALIDHTLMEYESFAGRHEREKRTLTGDLEQYFLFWLEQKVLLDALERSGMSGILIERTIRHAISETVLPQRFMTQENRQMQQHVIKFAVCGLTTIVLHWHHDGYKESPRSLATVAERLLTQPLFPEASQLL
jgi:AcrR family transcriptional regulator